MKQLVHTPEGVRDIYGNEYAKKLKIQDKIHHVLKSYGYDDIQTPNFEFFDIFSKEKGSVSTQEMFKFFDRDNNTLVLRPDMTPPISRCVTKYYQDETLPIRLCYLADTYTNNNSFQGRLKETTQQGAELLGDETSDSDAEMIAMMIECLLKAGLTDFQIDIGQVEFFNGLVEEAGMDEDTEKHLRELIEIKNFFGVEELVNSSSMEQSLKEVFLMLPKLFGSYEQLALAKNLTGNERSLNAIRRLENIYRLLTYYGLEKYVSFDLGMLGKYKYYTGIIFKAYTYGTGEAIGSGGRYDSLMKHFGKDCPSVGFSICIDFLMAAMDRQSIFIETEKTDAMLVYAPQEQETAIRLATHFRKQGMSVQLTRKRSGHELSEYERMASENLIEKIMCLDASNGIITEKCLADGTESIVSIPEILN
ncbi:MAG: ATP phosphoribosyltransferase regulatory subunit [Lachnospiraceae bacterium]|nr:ATP phosphoribosyltransferase regulatory subunit [Lachnospiraceae bacterium]